MSASALEAGIQTPADPKTVRRVLAAGFLGTTIEYYDFFIYGTAAALVFPQLFFPDAGPVVGTMASFATFGVAFLARPLGGIIFGHIGDRVGRKATLVATLLIMGLATVAIGLLPGHAAIGLLAPILLVALRFLQGLAVGGEMASVALFVGEYSPDKHRARYTLSPVLGNAAGLILATLVFLIISSSMSSAAFVSWGWRIPFVISIVLVAVGMFIRLQISETPVFKEALERQDLAQQKPPIVQVFTHQRRQVLLGAGTIMMGFSFFYLASTFLTNYGTSTLGYGRNDMLLVGLIGCLFFAFGGVAGAFAADRVGRRRALQVVALTGVLLSFAFLPVVGFGIVWAASISAFTLFLSGASTAITTPLLPEIFRTAYRSTGMGVAFNLGAIVGGGVVPIIAIPILASEGGVLKMGGVMVALSVIALVSISLLPETRGRTLSDELPMHR